MAMHQLRQYASTRATKRLYRAMPWIGGLVVLATLGAAVRRKGVFRGTLHTVLDFIPYVGGAKNLAEAVRGRDFIRDKRTAQRGVIRPTQTVSGRRASR